MTRLKAATKRGRPTKAMVAEITKAITAAATELFLAEGYSATAIEGVAARAGVSKVTIYSRFPTKADLFAAVVADRVAKWSAEAGKKDANLPDTPRGRLEHHALVAVESLSQPDIVAFSQLIAAEQRRFPEIACIYREHAFAFELKLLVTEIEAIASEAGRSSVDATSVAMTLMQALTGWASLNLVLDEPAGPAEQRRMVRRVIDLLIGGLSTW